MADAPYSRGDSFGGGVEQLAARVAHTHEVVGSSPTPATSFDFPLGAASGAGFPRFPVPQKPSPVFFFRPQGQPAQRVAEFAKKFSFPILT